MVEIIGRDAELERLATVLEGRAPDRRIALLEGEAGIGKTTVWRAALEAAAARGALVLRAQPTESEQALSYAALGDLVNGVDEAALGSLPPPQRRALEAALGRVEPDAPVDPRLVAAGFVSALSSVGAARDATLAVDDVQWLDAASALALEYAVGRLPDGVCALLARRAEPSEPLPLGLGRVPTLERLRLAPLSLASLHHLLRSRLGRVPSRPALVRLAGASGGNPFFALELARAWREDDATLHVPPSLQTLLASRIEGVAAGTLRVLVYAAALPRPTAPQLRAAIGEHADVGAALEEAEAAGLLALGGERVAFMHPLLAAVVLAAAPADERRRVHRRLAELARDPEERGHHLAHATIEPDAGAAAEIAAAAAAAARRGAQVSAAELYDAAVRVTPPEAAEKRAERLLARARALLAAGDVPTARGVAEEAVAPGAPTRAEALLTLGEIAWLESAAEAQALLEEALAEARDRVLRARIHAKLAVLSVTDQRAAARHADAAASLLHDDDDPALLAYVLLARLFYRTQTGLGAEPELLERALALEARAGAGGERSSLALIWLRCVDDLERARARYHEEERWYRERGEEGWAAEKASHGAFVELRAGDWDAAEQIAERTCAELEQLGVATGGGPWALPFLMRATVDVVRGRVDRALATARTLVADAEAAGNDWFAAIGLGYLGFVELCAGAPAAADDAFRRREARLVALGVEVPLEGPWGADAVEAAVGAGDRGRARATLAALEREGRAVPRLWIDVSLPRARANVLAAEGDVPGALAALEELDEERAERLPFDLARGLLERGRLRRRVKQRAAAAADLRRAAGVFARLGAPLWEAQTVAELDRVGLRRGSGDELTETERRIAELAASGLTNRAVAEAAFVSPKTVEANLARVYRKLGIRSRAELGARFATGAGGPPYKDGETPDSPSPAQP